MSKRWKIFAVLALMYILAYFFRISMAVVARDLAADLTLSAAQLGTLSGVFFYIYAFVQIPLGPLLDRFGGRTRSAAPPPPRSPGCSTRRARG